VLDTLLWLQHRHHHLVSCDRGCVKGGDEGEEGNEGGGGSNRGKEGRGVEKTGGGGVGRGGEILAVHS
jgi:hypothetical protein